jgi:hypothetical protein
LAVVTCAERPKEVVEEAGRKEWLSSEGRREEELRKMERLDWVVESSADLLILPGVRAQKQVSETPVVGSGSVLLEPLGHVWEDQTHCKRAPAEPDEVQPRKTRVYSVDLLEDPRVELGRAASAQALVLVLALAVRTQTTVQA